MNPPPLPPIPSPPHHYWRQFRINVLPHAIFALVLLAVVWLWGRNLASPLLTGQVAGLEAEIASPRNGQLTELKVTLYQEVKAGDILAVVGVAEPAILSNTLALARAEMQAIRTEGGFRPTDKVRYATFEFDWLKLRAELASLQAEYDYAKSELDRATPLYAAKLIPEAGRAGYDFYKADFEVKRHLLADKQSVVQEMEQRLRELNPTNSLESQYVSAALAVAEEKFRLAESRLAPVILTSPISGRVRAIDKLVGMTVSSGVPIITISSPDASYIIGFIQQPLSHTPQVGDQILVRNRGIARLEGAGVITGVGPRVELFNSPLRIRGMDSAQQRGQPLMVSLPDNLRLVPGELVDLTLVSKASL